LLEQVLNHPRIALVTFDFTSDVGILLEEGINVNLKSIIDCQMAKCCKRQGRILTHSRCQGLAFFLKEGSVDDDRLFALVERFIKEKKDLVWDAISFVIRHDRLPKDSFVSRSLLEYAATDVTLTGLVCSVQIKRRRFGNLLGKTRQKVFEFKKVNEEDATPLAASVVRHASFCRDTTDLKEDISNEIGLRKALKLCNALYTLNVGERILRRQLGQMSLEARQEKEQSLVKVLEEHMPRIRALANLP
jgi:hypothetical protein